MPRCARQSAGFTLVELLLVISLVGILAALIVPRSDPSVQGRLDAIADVVAGDLALARSLAVANDSSYRVTFDVSRNQYTLEHSGSNPALNVLPPSPLTPRAANSTQQVVRIADLPQMGPPPELLAVRGSANPSQPVTTVEFGPLGQTSRSDETIIWLTAGAGEAARYICVRVNPVTGLATTGSVQATLPVGVTTASAAASPSVPSVPTTP